MCTARYAGSLASLMDFELTRRLNPCLQRDHGFPPRTHARPQEVDDPSIRQERFSGRCRQPLPRWPPGHRGTQAKKDTNEVLDNDKVEITIRKVRSSICISPCIINLYSRRVCSHSPPSHFSLSYGIYYEVCKRIFLSSAEVSFPARSPQPVL